MKIKAVIDVNVLVSSVIGPLGNSRKVLLAWDKGFFDVIISAGVIRELEEKLKLPRITKHFNKNSAADIYWLKKLLKTQSEIVFILSDEIEVITGDPEDDYVLTTAALGKVNYLVTGDMKLQNVGSYKGIKILSPKEFITLIRKK